MIPIDIIRKYQQIILKTPNTASPLPLMEHPLGGVTNEQCLIQEFYGKIYMATAGQCFYIDRFHELCICVHYNFRIPGEYRFNPVYRYYITKKRMCNSVHQNMGEVVCSEMIITEFSDINKTKEYGLYDEFLSLKKKIEKSVEWRKANPYDPFEFGLTDQFYYIAYGKDKFKYTVYETPFPTNNEMVQFYFNNEIKKWEKMSVSNVYLSDLMTFFKDFETIDNNELHLRRFLPVFENAVCEEGEYHNVFTYCDNLNNQRISR